MTGTVHPRVGGEHTRPAPASSGKSGSSPRGRGTPEFNSDSQESNRFIPAWAGNTRSATLDYGARTVHPRVGGEHNDTLFAALEAAGSSPRGRGTLTFSVPELVPNRFIPAWAGNTTPL